MTRSATSQPTRLHRAAPNAVSQLRVLLSATPVQMLLPLQRCPLHPQLPYRSSPSAPATLGNAAAHSATALYGPCSSSTNPKQVARAGPVNAHQVRSSCCLLVQLPGARPVPGGSSNPRPPTPQLALRSAACVLRATGSHLEKTRRRPVMIPRAHHVHQGSTKPAPTATSAVVPRRKTAQLGRSLSLVSTARRPRMTRSAAKRRLCPPPPLPQSSLLQRPPLPLHPQPPPRDQMCRAPPPMLSLALCKGPAVPRQHQREPRPVL